MERQIATRISEADYALLEANAAENERSVSAELRLAVRAWAERLEKKPEEAAA